MGNYISSLFGFGGHPIARKLKRDLEELQQRRNLTAQDRRTEAVRLIKEALERLKTTEPTDFQEARRSGSGCFIEILKVSKAAGFGEKLLFQEDVNAGGGKVFRPTKDGYLQKTYQSKADGEEVTENVVSGEEFVGVSLLLW